MTPPLPLSLIRIEQNEHATFGLLRDAERNRLCVTLELPWKDNAHDVSCIPAGTYTAHRRFSPKHHCEVFELDGVPDRANIELHIGNFAHDSLGCILLGDKYGSFEGERGILGSRVAFERFMSAMAGTDAFTLDVMNPFPVAA